MVYIFRGHSVATSPDLGRLDNLQIKASDKTEVAAASLQGPEQIGVARLVGLYDGTVGQDDLVVDDGVAGPANLVTIEVDASGQKQSGDTDGAQTATWRGEVIIGEVSVDVLPSRSRTRS